MPISKDPEDRANLINKFVYGTTNPEIQKILDEKTRLEEEIDAQEEVKELKEEFQEPAKPLMEEEPLKDVMKLISLRLPESFLKKIDEKLKSKINVTRNSWISQAIQKEFERENEQR